MFANLLYRRVVPLIISAVSTEYKWKYIRSFSKHISFQTLQDTVEIAQRKIIDDKKARPTFKVAESIKFHFS